MTRQTSYQMDETTEAYVLFLKDRGFGTTSNILRTAVKRMAEEEGRTMTTTMTTVVFQPDMFTAEVVSIIRDTPHHVDGEFYDFATESEAASFVASFCHGRPDVRMTGEYTRRAVRAVTIPAE